MPFDFVWRLNVRPWFASFLLQDRQIFNAAGAVCGEHYTII
jgi:hypothetical protein